MPSSVPQTQTNAVLAAIVESSDDAIISKTLDGTIQTWNRAAERMFGYTAAEAIGSHITLIIPPDLRFQETEIISAIRRGERIAHFETIRVSKDGRALNISLTVSPIKDASGVWLVRRKSRATLRNVKGWSRRCVRRKRNWRMSCE
jgi:PAS domain S-box-containing protein